MGPRASAAVAAAAVLAGFAGAGHAAAVEKPETVCVVSDERLPELSGLASDGERWYAVNDGGGRVEVYVLNRECDVDRVITADVDPYDVEDLALDRDGTLWLADTGDNRESRETVAVHKLTSDGRASLHRLTYPDGAQDAEALLLDRSGTPHIVTKNALGASVVYRPTGPLRSPGPTPLEEVDRVHIPATETAGGPAGAPGALLVTGGAVSADGTVVALRTYTDAYLYPAPDGDVVSALGREPVRVPLPGEEQGEAIAFEPDGTLLSASEHVGQPVRAVRDAPKLVARPQNTHANETGRDPQPMDAADIDAAFGVPPLQGIAVVAIVVGVVWFGGRQLRRLRRRS